MNQLRTKHVLTAFMGLITLLMLINIAWMLNSESAVENDTTWQRIQDKGVISVGVDISFAPFGIYDPSGPIGVDPDVARAIADEWGVDVRFVLVNYDGMYDSLLVGEVDMLIAAVRPEPRRAAATRYTDPYFDGGYVLVGTSELPARIDALQGAILGVVFASDGDVWAQDYLSEHTDAFVLHRLDDVTQLVSSLTNGTVNYALLDHISAYQAQQQHANLWVAGQTLVDDPFVIVVRRSDWKLYAELQRTLDDLHTDGTLSAIILRWI